MASKSMDNGYGRVQYFVGGKRHAIRLGHLGDGRAGAERLERFRAKVHDLERSLALGQPPSDETVLWLNKLDDDVHAKLSKYGLVQPRVQTSMTLEKLAGEFMAAAGVIDSTRTTMEQTVACLFEFFDKTTPIRAIGPLQCEKWRQWMKDAKGYAQATISKRVKTARQMFRKAIAWKCLADNPLASVIAGKQSNKARQHFISREDAARVLAACPDAEWRLIFALCRYGGLRCTSEVHALRWCDVDERAGNLTVRSPKTEHQGKPQRVVPLFGELAPFLLEVKESRRPQPGDPVISQHAAANANLRTSLCRFIRRAGLVPWPRVFNNLRSTRQTEIESTYGIQAACAWIGNTQGVATEHYLQVTPEVAQRARKGEPTAHRTAQQGQETAGNGAAEPGSKKQNCPDLPGDSDGCLPLPGQLVTPRGFEPLSPP